MLFKDSFETKYLKLLLNAFKVNSAEKFEEVVKEMKKYCLLDKVTEDLLIEIEVLIHRKGDDLMEGEEYNPL